MIRKRHKAKARLRAQLIMKVPTDDPGVFGFGMAGGTVQKVNFDNDPDGNPIEAPKDLTNEYSSIGVSMNNIRVENDVADGAASPPNATTTVPTRPIYQVFTFTVPVLEAGIINTTPDTHLYEFFDENDNLLASWLTPTYEPGIDLFVGAKVISGPLIKTFSIKNIFADPLPDPLPFAMELDELIFTVPTNANIKEFNLSGVEVIKGIDIGDVRYGTTFIGEVYEGLTKVGYWWTVIRHTDTENIEVCGGTNNLLKVKFVVVLNDGSLAGNRMVLGLQDPSIVEDVVWDATASICGPACFDEDCACPNNPDLIEDWNCGQPMPEGNGPVATIENLELIEKFGSTLNIEEAFLSGWLCHNWAIIPRVAATLTVVLDE